MQNYIESIGQYDLKEFDLWYDEKFKQPATDLTIFHKKLTLIESYGNKLFGSENACKTPYLVANDISHLMDERQTLNDYHIFGFWGYGANSYAVIYAWLHKNIRVYLRLPFGGVYTDNKKAARFIPQIIHKTDRLVQKAIKESASLSFYCLMGPGSFRYYGSEFYECEFKTLYDKKSGFLEMLEGIITNE